MPVDLDAVYIWSRILERFLDDAVKRCELVVREIEKRGDGKLVEESYAIYIDVVKALEMARKILKAVEAR